MWGEVIIYWDEQFLFGFEQYSFRKNYHFSVDFVYFEYIENTPANLRMGLFLAMPGF